MKKMLILLAVLLLAGCSPKPIAPAQTQVTTPTLVSFDVFAVNDLHGKLSDTDAQPGVDELTSYFRKFQQAGNTILLATGDMWQGTAESSLTGGYIITEWMNEMGFAAMTLGGHEYDWGEEQIRKNADLAEFPLLAINIYDRETNRQADYCQSSVVIDIDGAQVGIIGAIGDCYGSISAQNTQNVYFQTGPQLTALVKKEAQMLHDQGVDFIIYAIHDGYDQNTTQTLSVTDRDIAGYYDTALSDGYVDLVFEADTHFSYTLVDRFGVYHLQNGGNNTGISHARVVIDTARGEHFVASPEQIPASRYSYLEDDPVVEALLQKYAQQIAPATQVLGINEQYRTGAMVCQLVADLYCRKGTEKWGDAYDIVLGGGYISCRSPGYLPAGEVTYSQLQSLLPFDNQITLCSIRGSDLLSRFLETDNSAYYIKLTDYGNKIRGKIDPDATYYVVTDSYSSDYTYNHLTVIDTYSPTVFARDLVAQYITG